MAALVLIPRPELQSESLLSRAELKGVKKNAAPPLSMFRVENSDAEGINKWGPGALVLVRHEAAETAERNVYFLVTHWHLLPSSSLSSLRRVNLHAPSGAALRGIPREWVQYVLVDSRRRTTLVQFTQQAVNAMLDTGVACREVATTAGEGMRATLVWGTSALTGKSVRNVRVVGETIKLDTPTFRSENGLLVAEDGSLLAVANYSDTYYSLAEIVSDFLEERMWQIRCRSLALTTRTTIIDFYSLHISVTEFPSLALNFAIIVNSTLSDRTSFN